MLLPKQMIKKKKKKLFYYFIHRSRQGTLTWSIHSTFESTSMAGKFLLSLSKADPVWVKDLKHLNGIILEVPILFL